MSLPKQEMIIYAQTAIHIQIKMKEEKIIFGDKLLLSKNKGDINIALMKSQERIISYKKDEIYSRLYILINQYDLHNPTPITIRLLTSHLRIDFGIRGCDQDQAILNYIENLKEGVKIGNTKLKIFEFGEGVTTLPTPHQVLEEENEKRNNKPKNKLDKIGL